MLIEKDLYSLCTFGVCYRFIVLDDQLHMSATYDSQEHPDARSHLLAIVITLGGERKALMEAQFQSLEGFRVEYVDGIPSRSIRRKDDLRAALEEAELVQPGDDELHQAMWLRCRSLSRDRAVLACYLAHLRAMRKAVQLGADVIFEDNVRMPAKPPNEAARRILECVRASPHADLRLFGFGARAEDHEAVYRNARPEDGALPLPFRFPPSSESEANTPGVKQIPAAWGAYAYWISRRGWKNLLHRIRNDMPMAVVAERGKNLRGYVVRPIDRILVSRCVSQDDCEEAMRSLQIRQAAGCSLASHELEGKTRIQPATVHLSRVVAGAPCCYRAPMLRSTIHDKWDGAFCESSEAQMRCCVAIEDSFQGLWLSEAEFEAVRLQQEHGEWAHTDGLQRKTWGNEKTSDDKGLDGNYSAVRSHQ